GNDALVGVGDTPAVVLDENGNGQSGHSGRGGVMSVDMGDRWRFTSALLGEDAAPPPDGPSPRVVRGVVLDVSRHMLVLATPEGEERFLFEEATRFWRGREAAPRELRLGDDVLARCAPGGRWVVDRVWARLGRVTGTITEVDGETVRVDPGHGRPAATAVVPYRSSGRMAVRHPYLRPGYLFDAIGLRRDGVVEASVPATTQAPYPVHRSPHRPPVRTMPPAVSAIVTWYDPAAGRAAHDDPRALLPRATAPRGSCGSNTRAALMPASATRRKSTPWICPAQAVRPALPSP